MKTLKNNKEKLTTFSFEFNSIFKLFGKKKSEMQKRGKIKNTHTKPPST